MIGEQRVEIHRLRAQLGSRERLAKLTGEEPHQQVTDDLRRFKQVLETGEVVRSEFHDGVINSNERMTYTAVNGILTDRDPELLQRYGRLSVQASKCCSAGT